MYELKANIISIIRKLMASEELYTRFIVEGITAEDEIKEKKQIQDSIRWCLSKPTEEEQRKAFNFLIHSMRLDLDQSNLNPVIYAYHMINRMQNKLVFAYEPPKFNPQQFYYFKPSDRVPHETFLLRYSTAEEVKYMIQNPEYSFPFTPEYYKILIDCLRPECIKILSLDSYTIHSDLAESKCCCSYYRYCAYCDSAYMLPPNFTRHAEQQLPIQETGVKSSRVEENSNESNTYIEISAAYAGTGTCLPIWQTQTMQYGDAGEYSPTRKNNTKRKQRYDKKLAYNTIEKYGTDNTHSVAQEPNQQLTEHDTDYMLATPHYSPSCSECKQEYTYIDAQKCNQLSAIYTYYLEYYINSFLADFAAQSTYNSLTQQTENQTIEQHLNELYYMINYFQCYKYYNRIYSEYVNQMCTHSGLFYPYNQQIT